MLAQMNMNEDDHMLAWRFSGVDLTQTTMISIAQLREIYKQGEYNGTCCSLAQYLVYYKLLGLSDTTNFNLEIEFDKDLEFVKENYEAVVSSLTETFTEIIKNKNNETSSTESSTTETTETSSESNTDTNTEESTESSDSDGSTL